MGEAKKRWIHVNGIRDETDKNLRRLENAPKNIIVAIEVAGTAIAEVGESRGPGLDGLVNALGAGIGMTKADANAEGNGPLDGRDGVEALGREGEQNRIVATDPPQFLHVLGFGIAHRFRIMGAAEARLIGKKRPFNVPAN